MTFARPSNRWVFAGMICLLESGCTPKVVGGPTNAQFPPAHQPQGVTAFLDLDDGTDLEGELLAVEAGALILVVATSSASGLDGRLVRVPLFPIRRALILFAGDFTVTWPAPSPPPIDSPLAEVLDTDGASLVTEEAIRDRLRLLARYPQGIGEELLTRLQGAYGAMEVLGSGSAQ